MKKFNVDVKKVLAVVTCVAAGVSAFVTESNNQQKEKTIAELVDRVSKLEGKES